MIAVVLMTALVPTIGHKALIDFALSLDYERVYVIVSGRSHEPTLVNDRVWAIQDEFFIESTVYRRLKVIRHEDDNAPQNPSTEKEWNYWRKLCIEATVGWSIDAVVSSEPYGKKMAELLGSEFIPFDMERRLLDVKGTDVRTGLAFDDLSKVMPSFRTYLKTRITIFGQESCGKTTLTNQLAASPFLPIDTIHEFARPYLEMMDDKSITAKKMHTIADGQNALQETAWKNGLKPILVQDTDLLSTIGYCRIYGCLPPDGIIENFKNSKSDLYIVMNDDIPFEENELRYGGKVRESSKQFWIDLLNEFECNFVEMKSIDREAQIWEAEYQIKQIFQKKILPIKDFVRE